MKIQRMGRARKRGEISRGGGDIETLLVRFWLSEPESVAAISGMVWWEVWQPVMEE